MFGPITIPFGAKMLFNTVRLKPHVTFEDVEMTVGELCSVVKQKYGGDKGGFIAGQVFKLSGFVSDKGYTETPRELLHSHADELFTNKFSALASMCSDTKELGYDMLWQGEAAS